MASKEDSRADSRVTDMNYVAAVYGVVVIIIVVDWFVRGKHHYRGQTLRHEEASHTLAAEAHVIR